MIHIKKNRCDFCGTCVGVCPENCLDLQEADLSIEQERCTRCEKCIVVCPVNALYSEREK